MSGGTSLTLPQPTGAITCETPQNPSANLSATGTTRILPPKVVIISAPSQQDQVQINQSALSLSGTWQNHRPGLPCPRPQDWPPHSSSVSSHAHQPRPEHSQPRGRPPERSNGRSDHPSGTTTPAFCAIPSHIPALISPRSHHPVPPTTRVRDRRTRDVKPLEKPDPRRATTRRLYRAKARLRLPNLRFCPRENPRHKKRRASFSDHDCSGRPNKQTGWQ